MVSRCGPDETALWDVLGQHVDEPIPRGRRLNRGLWIEDPGADADLDATARTGRQLPAN